jgi:hypothetical protein
VGRSGLFFSCAAGGNSRFWGGRRAQPTVGSTLTHRESQKFLDRPEVVSESGGHGGRARCRATWVLPSPMCLGQLEGQALE